MEKKIQKEKSSNGCVICGERGSKGYFSVPKESGSGNPPKREWLQIINETVTESTRVCFRHFAREELWVTKSGVARYRSGM